MLSLLALCAMFPAIMFWNNFIVFDHNKPSLRRIINTTKSSITSGTPSILVGHPTNQYGFMGTCFYKFHALCQANACSMKNFSIFHSDFEAGQLINIFAIWREEGSATSEDTTKTPQAGIQMLVEFTI